MDNIDYQPLGLKSSSIKGGSLSSIEVGSPNNSNITSSANNHCNSDILVIFDTFDEPSFEKPSLMSLLVIHN